MEMDLGLKSIYFWKYIYKTQYNSAVLFVAYLHIYTSSDTNVSGTQGNRQVLFTSS